MYRPAFDRMGGAVVGVDHPYGRPPKGVKRPPTPPASTSDLIEGALISTPHLREDPDFFLAGIAADETHRNEDEEEADASPPPPASPGSDSSKNSSSSFTSSSSAPCSTFQQLLARKKKMTGSMKRCRSPFVAKTESSSSSNDGDDADSSSSTSITALALKRARLNRPGRSPAVGSLDDLISTVVEHNSNPQVIKLALHGLHVR